MKTTTAHTIGIWVSMPMLALGIVCFITPLPVAKTVQYASIAEVEQVALQEYAAMQQKKCGGDDWLCLLAYADVTRGVR